MPTEEEERNCGGRNCGGRNCYHCGAWIPYTIHQTYWYCFECGFYTDNSVPEDQFYTGHKHQWKVAPIPGGIAQFCTEPYCSMEFTQSTEEYERDQEKGRLRNYLNSREWQEQFRVLDQYRRGTPVIVQRPPTKSFDEATPKDLERFQRFLQRKVDSRERRFQRKAERRLGK